MLFLYTGEDGLMQAYLELLEIHKPHATIIKLH
jgi:hypothetical protein